jgi:diacylglycerol kinase
MSVLKLPLLVYLEQKVGELVLSTTSCTSVIILENILNWCIEKMWLW